MRRFQFNDELKTADLLEKGYSRFPLLRPEDVESLLDIFRSYHTEDPAGFYATTHLENPGLRKQISDRAMEVVMPRIEPLFENAHVLGGAFITKAPGEKGILPLHQDWNIVDEEKERSYNLWIPLVDVNQHNGTMRILEASHMKESTLRGPDIAPTLNAIPDVVDRYMKPLEMRAGEGLLYDHALWHSSPVNQSDSLRIALVLGVISEGAEMRFYQRRGKVIEEYASDPLFFFDYVWGADPVGPEKLREIPYSVEMLDEAAFRKVYLGESVPAPKRKSLFSFFRAG